MNKKTFYTTLALGVFAFIPGLVKADSATPDFTPTQVEAKLNVDIDKSTSEVHFVSTNNDPDILTKVYILKHADPYEVRPYIRAAVQSKRVDSSLTGVETIVYNDGTGALIVSAEDYRFGKQEHGMGIDEMIQVLDQPKVTSSSGSTTMLYFPNFWDAWSLDNVMKNSGYNKAGDSLELLGGKDKSHVDPEINGILIHCPTYSTKRILRLLKAYDKPAPEILIKYSSYEIHSENAAQLGTDFQAWKNGPGADLFAASASYSRGWANTSLSARDYTGPSRSHFIKFNPKWDSRFLDFLSADSKAKVITEGILPIMNSTVATVSNTINQNLAGIKAGADIPDANTLNAGFIRLNQVQFATSTGTPNTYFLSAIDRKDGRMVVVKPATGVDFTITKSVVGSETFYYVKVKGTNLMHTDGISVGTEEKLFDAVLYYTDGTGAVSVVSNWNTSTAIALQKDVKRVTGVSKTGFTLSMLPTVCEQATELTIELRNTNLIGYENDGTPRTSTSEMKTTVMVSNTMGNKFYLGGLTKKALIKGASKVPYLGDLPGLGWIFGGESGRIVKTNIVTVIEATPLMPDTKLSPRITAIIDNSKKEINAAGQKDKDGNVTDIDYGYDQFLFDDNKKEFEPLP